MLHWLYAHMTCLAPSDHSSVTAEMTVKRIGDHIPWTDNGSAENKYVTGERYPKNNMELPILSGGRRVIQERDMLKTKGSCQCYVRGLYWQPSSS